MLLIVFIAAAEESFCSHRVPQGPQCCLCILLHVSLLAVCQISNVILLPSDTMLVVRFNADFSKVSIVSVTLFGKIVML